MNQSRKVPRQLDGLVVDVVFEPPENPLISGWGQEHPAQGAVVEEVAPGPVVEVLLLAPLRPQVHGAVQWPDIEGLLDAEILGVPIEKVQRENAKSGWIKTHGNH